MYNFSIESLVRIGQDKRSKKQAMVRVYVWEVRESGKYIVDIREVAVDYKLHKSIDWMLEKGYTMCVPFDQA